MRSNGALERLRAGKVALGTWLVGGGDLGAQVLGHAGFDWVLVDMEHGPLSQDVTQQAMLALLTTPAAPIVRVTWNESALIQAVLDMGAYGILVPMVETAEDAERAVRDARYPPRGRRSRGGLRAPFAFSTDPITYGRCADEVVLLAVQIESAAALEALDGIAAIAGVDVLFVGPSDLASSQGTWPPSWADPTPDFAAAIERVPRVAREHGKHAGILVYDDDAAKRCIELGYTFVAVGSDATMLQGAARATVAALSAARG